MDEEAASGRRGLLVFPEMTSTNGNGVVKFEEKMVCCRKASTTAGVGTGCEGVGTLPGLGKGGGNTVFESRLKLTHLALYVSNLV